MKNLLAISAICFMAITASAQSNERIAFNKTIAAYYDIKNALAKDNTEQSHAGVKAMMANLKANPKQYVESSQKQLWDEQSALLNKTLVLMQHEKDLKAQRKHFENLSYPMIKIVKAINLNDKVVYLQHCPMAKASWLNEVEAVQNPYYGSMMYDCGDVKETIK